ncbi:hypothetical protein MIMGU_mgv1a017426mg [Erythranthe guttata]|uniref:Uncharacterized protein n=1 Tax=Erythranthe guttata TaxID=4155 RepID=A0A022RKU3_ERYGU|nr:hypothetical protein MIMGU_mgv1a017426mg [Erythranthe guttata]
MQIKKSVSLIFARTPSVCKRTPLAEVINTLRELYYHFNSNENTAVQSIDEFNHKIDILSQTSQNYELHIRVETEAL